MPIPRRRIKGRILGFDEIGIPGSSVVFTPLVLDEDGNATQVNYIKDLDTDDLLVGTHTVKADDDGYWETPLPVTDSALSDPTDFVWQADVYLNRGRLLTKRFELPTSDQVIDLADVIDAVPNSGTYGSVVTVAQFNALTELVKAGGVGGAYRHVQDEPAATWVVEHNLGRCPTPTLLLSGEQQPQYTDIEYPDENTLIVEWDVPLTGIAYV
jgi:hypothetical protein